MTNMISVSVKVLGDIPEDDRRVFANLVKDLISRSFAISMSDVTLSILERQYTDNPAQLMIEINYIPQKQIKASVLNEMSDTISTRVSNYFVRKGLQRRVNTYALGMFYFSSSEGERLSEQIGQLSPFELMS